jgi:hypothetical protein
MTQKAWTDLNTSMILQREPNQVLYAQKKKIPVSFLHPRYQADYRRTWIV